MALPELVRAAAACLTSHRLSLWVVYTQSLLAIVFGEKDCSRQSFLAIVFVLKHSIVLGGVLASLAQSGGRVCKQSRKHANTIKQAKGTAKHQKKNTQRFNQTKNQSSKQSMKHTINQIKQSAKKERKTRKKTPYIKK